MIFIEVYLADCRVAPFHPGPGNLVTCDDLAWQFAARAWWKAACSISSGTIAG